MGGSRTARKAIKMDKCEKTWILEHFQGGPKGPKLFGGCLGCIKASLCHKGEFNPSWMVNAVLLLDLFYVTLICTLGQEPKIFIELFFRNNSSWWLKIYLFRLIHIFQSIYPLCI